MPPYEMSSTQAKDSISRGIELGLAQLSSGVKSLNILRNRPAQNELMFSRVEGVRS